MLGFGETTLISKTVLLLLLRRNMGVLEDLDSFCEPVSKFWVSLVPIKQRGMPCIVWERSLLLVMFISL